jgi:DNA primase
MSGLIPQHFIDDLLARTDIIALINGYVPLRKAGKNFQANCPFHDEKTPSFTVSQDKQFYHCFGCGANGTAIGFLMEYKQMDFVSAVEDLARMAGLEVPREGGRTDPDKKNQLAELYELLEMCVQYYKKQLKAHPQSEHAIEYLKKRGISGELAAQMELGFAPPGWENLITELGKSDAAQQRLFKTGMLIKRDTGGFYDRFRDRIMYPIRDYRGRAIGFGGRVINEGTPKYLNSPETPVFHKGRELYGLYQARQSTKDIRRLVIVEGYMDVLALKQHGIDNTAATLGTAATTDHLENIFRYLSQIVFCFDGDTAGQKAAWRALEICLPYVRDGRQIYFRFLPTDQDPDDYVRQHGKDAFLDESSLIPLSEYLISELTQDFNPQVDEHKGELIHAINPYLSKLPESSLKEILLGRIARLTDLDEDRIRNLITTEQKPSRKLISNKPAAREDRKVLSQVIKLLLQDPDLARLIPNLEEVKLVKSDGMQFLIELIDLILANEGITCGRILERWRGTKFEKRLSQLAPGGQTQYSADDSVLQSREFLQAEFLGAIEHLVNKSAAKEKLAAIGNKRPSDMSEDEKAMFRKAKTKPQSPGKT